ncbi:zinc dependent phospholipase C family protein [Sanyastnella coralliicola]|uniref:zinc dependent phospholipase C family protein n=1 Tax=Sanyastnella coralliicola TaxID=3069118 RepID=UPI0027BAD02A|nr:zinc dependent phospholipase C family protein [Longitalea sp. SCSIO 12813]
MSRFIKLLVLALFLISLPAEANAPWGFFAHRRINELAVYTLPTPLFSFYKEHIDFIKEHAVDPDKRRYGVKGEAERHYIDIDHYYKYDTTGRVHANPFNLMPRKWVDAVEKYTEDTLRAYGIVPWHIPMYKDRLTRAFEQQDVAKILRYSAELGHYIADAHVPLHTTENYNGQMTNQKGIHGFWESRIPELYEDNWDFFVGKARYVENPLDISWAIVEASHAGVDSVLRFERELNEQFPQDAKYSYEERGRVLTKVYSEEYSKAYYDMLDGQQERRMRASVIMVGSVWYSAWVDAGQPNLVLSQEIDLEEAEKAIQEELNVESKPELKKREHE